VKTWIRWHSIRAALHDEGMKTEIANPSRKEAQSAESERSASRRFAIGLARAFGGAVIFSLPLMMTMEMWWLGFHIDPLRLAALLLVLIPLLILLSHYAGFEEVFLWKDQVLDAFAAFAVGAIAAALVLILFAVLDLSMPLHDIVGKISLQAVPGSIGAILAQSQLGGEQGKREQERKRRDAGYWGEIFIMGVGALFLAFNVAPTEEMVLIAYKMTSWHAIALALASLFIMHAFVYSVEFHGQHSITPETSPWSLFLRFTVVGYAVALLISLYILWTFGQTDGVGLQETIAAVIVLGFPAALGAAAARLIL